MPTLIHGLDGALQVQRAHPDCSCPNTCDKGGERNGYRPNCRWPQCFDQSKYWADTSPQMSGIKEKT